MAVTFAFTAPITASFAAYPPLGSTTERLGSVAQWATSSVKAQWATNAGPIGMGAVNVPTAQIMEGTRPHFVARVLWPDGSVVAAADINGSGTLRIYREGDETETVVDSQTVVVGKFVALTTDGYWTADSTGYNFRYQVDADASFPEGGESYICQFTFTGDEPYGRLLFQGRIVTRGDLTA